MDRNESPETDVPSPQNNAIDLNISAHAFLYHVPTTKDPVEDYLYFLGQ